MMKTLIFIFISSGCFAQKLSDDFNKIVEKIESVTELSLSITAIVKTSEKGNVIYTSKSKLLRNKNLGFLTIIDGEELLVTKEYEIAIDKEEKNVIVQKIKKLDENDFSKKALSDIKKYFEEESGKNKNNHVEKLISDAQGVRKYSLKNIEGISEIRFELDMKNFKIIKIEYWFDSTENNQKYYCVVNYDTFDYAPKIDSKLISTSNYFTIDSSGNYVLTSRFSNYKLVKR